MLWYQIQNRLILYGYLVFQYLVPLLEETDIALGFTRFRGTLFG